MDGLKQSEGNAPPESAMSSNIRGNSSPGEVYGGRLARISGNRSTLFPSTDSLDPGSFESIGTNGADLEVKVTYGDWSHVYFHCQLVRADAGDANVHYPFDAHSFHFVMYYKGDPIGAMTATCCLDGAVDQDQFYPRSLLRTHQTRVFSSCKLRINSFKSQGPGPFRLLVRSAWSYLLHLGLRIDVMNCEVEKRSRYEAVGYRCLEGFDFVHADLGTASRVMILSADRDHTSLFRNSFRTLTDPVSLPELLASLQLKFRAPESAVESLHMNTARSGS
jgi:hypothetical protein